MAALRLIVPGADFSATGLGKFAAVPNPRSSLYAAWLLGTTFGTNPLKDISGNGRNLALSAGAFGTQSIFCSPADYPTAPFTGRQLGAVTGGASLVIVAKSAYNRNDFLIGDYTDNGHPAIVLLTTSSAHLNAFDNDAGQYTAQIGVSADPVRGSRYEMYAGSFTTNSVLAYRGWGDPLVTAAETATSTPNDVNLGNLTNITIGSGPGAPYSAASAPEVVAAFAYSAALTAAELDVIRAGVRTLLSGYGVTL